MRPRELVFRVHAVKRMFQRSISAADIRAVLEQGNIIEEYPDDQPYPSRLFLGKVNSRFLHVVVADRPDAHETIIITVYEPDPMRWDTSFRLRL